MSRSTKEQYIMGALPLVSTGLTVVADSLVEDLTYRQFYLLRMISRMNKGEKSVREVADFCGTSRQNIRKMLETLRAQGYVELRPSRFDGRALCVSLTRKANALIKRASPSLDQELSSLFAHISDAELDNVVASISMLAQCLDDAQEV